MKPNIALSSLEATQEKPAVLVAAGISLFDGAGRLLLLQRPSGEWDLPGGHLEPGESCEQTARRELLEETGLEVGRLELLGIASGKAFYVPKCNVYYVTALYRAVGYEGDLKLSHEHTAGEFFALEALPEVQAPAVREFMHRMGSKATK